MLGLPAFAPRPCVGEFDPRRVRAPSPRERAIAARKKTPAGVKKLLKAINKALEDGKAEDIVVIDLDNKTAFADFMVVATGRSQRQLAALADHVTAAVEALGAITVPSEGRALGDWILIDAGDVIVHLFRPTTRAHYNLEKMWGAELPESDRVAV